MEKIQPIQIWVNGSIQTANYLNLNISLDNLQSSCIFYYQLTSSEDLSDILGYGNLIMEGEDYLNWNGSNNDAYTYALNKLNLTPADL
jgi:hypothetical protein